MRGDVVFVGAVVLSVIFGLSTIADDRKPVVKPYSLGYEEQSEVAEETETEAQSEIQGNPEWVEFEEFETALFVGDSRVVGMSQSSGRYSYIGKTGAGYDWLISSGEPELRKMLAEYPNMDVVLSFGVNDLGNLESYIAEYKKIKNDFPDTRIWVMSVMPVLESVEAQTGYSVQNSAVDNFNERLQEEFGDRYIDTYSYLIANGFSTFDGVHYTGETYVDLENYVVYFIMSNLNMEG